MRQENGPFRFDSARNGTIVRNENSWTTIANVIWLEMPVGVGFSYAEHGDYVAQDDQNTAAKNHAALVHFFSKFPQLRGRDLFISGESYAVCRPRQN